MFKVEVFVDDKKLGDVLRALTGLVRGQPAVVPVVNVDESGGIPKAESNGSLLHMFEVYLKKSHAKMLNAGDIQQWLEKQGASRLSAVYLAKKAIAAGLIRRTGHGAAVVYHVKGK